MISIFVPGEPAPQGSKIAKCINGRAVMWEASGKVKKWREAISESARFEMQTRKLEPLTGSVEVVLHYLMPRGKTVTRKDHTVKPDLDKLIRATLDGLTGIVFKDDAQVNAISAAKDYGVEKTGVQIFIVEESDV